jgi:hypothetical protein
MTDEKVPSVDEGEILARFVLRSGWVRAIDKSIRPDAFIPAPNLELSVTRYLGLADADVWQIGRDVAQIRNLTLYGSADFKAKSAITQSLRVVSAEPPRNHTNIVGWPQEKPVQKAIAQALARSAIFVVASATRGDEPSTK